MKMKALVKAKPEPGIWLQDVAIPEIGINDVLVKIHQSSICGTDVHIYNWDAWAQKTIPVPMVVGHEFVGEIVEVGSNVNDWHPGQIVSGEGHVVCGRCRNCMAGRRHLCAFTSGIGVNRPGAFAEYMVTRDTCLYHKPPALSFDAAALTEPLSGAWKGVVEHSELQDFIPLLLTAGKSLVERTIDQAFG